MWLESSYMPEAYIVPISIMFGLTAWRMLMVFSWGSWGSASLLFLLLAECSGSTLLWSWSRTAWTMGTIMAVVAVLLIHMDRKAVTPMNPSINLWGEGIGLSLRNRGSDRLPLQPCGDRLGSADSQGRSDSNYQQHPERDAFVEVPVLDGYGDHQAPDKQHVGVLQVLHTHLDKNKEETK